nr:retrovirus-related Pol polyprotein from transposon TNT 1-94 [Tanacetum cinerariifolium]
MISSKIEVLFVVAFCSFYSSLHFVPFVRGCVLCWRQNTNSGLVFCPELHFVKHCVLLKLRFVQDLHWFYLSGTGFCISLGLHFVKLVLAIARRCLQHDDILNGVYGSYAVEATDDSPAIPKHTTIETRMNMSPENKDHFLAEKEAIHLILTGTRDEIYSTVDACQTAQEMWEAIERLQQEGVDLLTRSRGNNLYTLSLGDMNASSHICLLSKASKTKSWLWHRRLSHLNFSALNHLARHGLVHGLPKLKFEKDHLCSACAMGKSKKKLHKPKSEVTNQEKLYLLHMDLYGPMYNNQ